MQELTHEEKKFFRKLNKEFSKQKETFFYNIVHQLNIEPTNLWVSSSLTPEAMCGISAYIEHVSFELTNECCTTLDPKEIMELINKFYFKVEYLPNPPDTEYYEIDLYLNWEDHAGLAYEEGMPELHREGFLDYVKEMSIRNKWGQDLEVS